MISFFEKKNNNKNRIITFEEIKINKETNKRTYKLEPQNHFRASSEFLTTYKYSNSEYTRKYLGLSQVKKLVKTFPIVEIEQNTKKINKFCNLINNRDYINIIKFIKNN